MHVNWPVKLDGKHVILRVKRSESALQTTHELLGQIAVEGCNFSSKEPGLRTSIWIHKGLRLKVGQLHLSVQYFCLQYFWPINAWACVFKNSRWTDDDGSCGRCV